MGGQRLRVETLVFFDLESTGLPSFIPKRQVNITEVGMVAIRRDNFMSPLRYLNKMTLCVRPRYSISDGASRLSGLYNEELERYPPFDDCVQLIMQFLDSLPKPACLLAHNGNKFDFPLLTAELKRLGVGLEISCCDTLPALKHVISLGTHNNNNNKSVEEQELAALERLPDDFWTAFDACDIFDEGATMVVAEVTPSKHVKTQPFNAGPRKKPKPDEVNMSQANGFRRALFKDDAMPSVAVDKVDSQNNGCSSRHLQGLTPKKTRQLHSLAAIYDMFFGESLPNAHSADADCLALAKVCNYVRDAFLDYIDAHYVPLHNILSMW
ncbi:three-prime repair exonuclease 1-like isoform X2 [Ornithodoros turicata]